MPMACTTVTMKAITLDTNGRKQFRLGKVIYKHHKERHFVLLHRNCFCTIPNSNPLTASGMINEEGKRNVANYKFIK